MKIPIKLLYVLSALYITVPLVIFAFGWMKLPFALSIGLGFIYLLYQISKQEKAKDSLIISWKELGVICLLVIIWTLLSGAGHRGFSDGDGYKHNAILNDLIALDWPVMYQQFKTKEFVYLCYYIAYYLPAALVGKLFGWKIANIVLFGWTLAGALLALSWFLLVFKKGNKVLISSLFVFFGGLDVLGRFIMRNKVVNGTDWEWWARNWQYSGNTTLLFYVPQHALVGWIAMGVLVYGLMRKKHIPFFLALISCIPLWSPFVFLGLVPFVLIYWYQNKNSFRLGEWLVAAVFIAYQLLYFASNLTFFVKETGVSAWLWQVEKLVHSWVLLRLFLFYLFEFGVFVLFIVLYKKTLKNTTKKLLFSVSVCILLLLPWYKMGLLNDFVMRVSIPALWVLSLFWIELFIQKKWDLKFKAQLFLFFILGAIYPLILFTHGVQQFSWGPPKASLTTYEDPVFRRQYLGSDKSIFFTYFTYTNIHPKVGQMKYK
jgi:hypothetical protein